MSYDPRFAGGPPASCARPASGVRRSSRTSRPRPARPVPDPGLLDPPEGDGVRRSDVRSLHAVARSPGGLPGEVRDAHRAGNAVRGEARRRSSGPSRSPACRYGALSRNAKQALGGPPRGSASPRPPATAACAPRSAKRSDTLVYQVLPSRYGFNPDHLKLAEAIEVVVGQGAKPGTGGMLLGAKVSEEIAEQRDAAAGRRPAQPGPASRLHRAGRPAASRSRSCGRRPTGRSRLREDGRQPRRRRREARREGRRRRHRASTGWRGHRRLARGAARPHGHSHAGRASARRVRALDDIGPLRRGPARDLRGHPERDRRRQGAGARRRRRLDRHGGADRAELQRAAVRRGLPEARRRAGRLPPLPHGPLPGRDHHPGPRADEARSTSTRPPTASSTSWRDDHGDADARPRLRQTTCTISSPRTCGR